MNFFRFSLALILIFSGNQLIAQNYQTINSSQINYFATSNLDYVLATRTDSVENVGSDSTFYSFKTFRGDAFIDSAYAGASWFGKKTTISSNGLNTFVNQNDEEIRIETQATLGDTFDFYAFPNGIDTVFGTITLQDTLTILGTLDSIKEITLFSTGPSFVISGEKLIISRDHGFVRVFPFYSFPSSYQKASFEGGAGSISTTLNLVGSNFPRIGITMLTKGEMYSANVNDYIIVQQSHLCSPTFSSGAYTLKRSVVNKIGLGGNSIQIDFNNNFVASSSNGFGCWSTSYPTSMTISDTNEYIEFLLPEELATVSPGDSSYVHFISLDYTQHCGEQLMTSHKALGITWLPNDFFQTSIEPSFTQEQSIAGFGQMLTTGALFESSSMTYANISGSIEYYTIGTTQCGDSTAGFDELYLNEVVLSPNPTSGSLKIQSSKKMDNISIMDITGKIVFESDVNSFESQLQLDKLKSGVYLVQVKLGSEISTERVILR